MSGGAALGVPSQNRGALDFECSNWTIPVSAMLAWGPPGERCEQFLGTYNRRRKRWAPLDVGEVLEHLVVLAQLEGVDTWWAHNGGKYDWLFLVHEAARLGWYVTGHCAAGRAIYLRVEALDGTVLHLYDSMALVPAALKEAAEDWALPTRKLFGADDYSVDAALWSESRMVDGVRADAHAVLELVEAVETQAAQWGGECRSTFSGTAFSLLRGRYELPDMRKLADWNAIAQHAYSGGRVEVLRHAPAGPVWEFDLNSSYPWSMTQRLPLVPRRRLDSRHEVKRWWRGGCGLVLADVTVPEQWLAPLPWVHPDGGLFFPTGRWKAWFHCHELAHAEEVAGVQVRPLMGLEFHPTDFTALIEELYAVKTASKGAKREFAKRSMNGAYGKFGQRPEREVIRVFGSEEDCAAWVAELPEWRLEPNARNRVRVLSDQVVTEQVVRYAKSTNFATAGAITAHSRMKLYDCLRTASVTACYCDTDSVFSQAPLPAELCHPSELGKMKLAAELRGAHFYAPKLYHLHHKERQKVKVEVEGKRVVRMVAHTYAAKGFPVNPKDFELAVGGELVVRDRMQLLKSQLKNMAGVARVEDAKAWSGLSGKRKPLEGVTGETRPWTVRELLEEQHLAAVSPLGRKAHRAMLKRKAEHSERVRAAEEAE